MAEDERLTPELVGNYIRAHVGEVRACYERALEDDRTLAGKLVMYWEIDVTGATTAIKAESNTMANSAVYECVRAIIGEWRFPKPGGTVQISFPFVFQPCC